MGIISSEDHAASERDCRPNVLPIQFTSYSAEPLKKGACWFMGPRGQLLLGATARPKLDAM